MDLSALVTNMQRDGTFESIALNRNTQFGRRARRYVGAEILPERIVPLNEYKEEGVRYRTVIANGGTRYGPVQKKGGALVGEFFVTLAESDIGSELTSHEYDTLLRLLQQASTIEAVANIINFLDTTVNLPLVERNEAWRWQAIVDAAVVSKGDNSYSETINYSNPSGHRINAADSWSDDAYDPMDDLWAGAALLASKGFTRVARIFSSRNVTSIMSGNAKIAQRAGRVAVSTTGQIQGIPGRVQLTDINGILGADGLPPMEEYDLQYRTQTGTARFFPNNVVVMIGLTGRDERLDLGDVMSDVIVPNTLGYMAVGRPAGVPRPGRVVQAVVQTDKPPRIEAEGWQTSLPVILEPEAMVVIKNIS